MFQRIKNALYITINASNGEAVDLSDYTNITVYIEQNEIKKQYTNATVATGTTNVLVVTIPKADAMLFRDGSAYLQIAMTNGNGVPVTHSPIKFDVYKFLWEDGYGN